jgi:drug/metabolite transporter (DMT)-like permease
MKPISWVGILLIVLGALVLAYQGINYTRQKKVLDVGSVHVTTETHERIPLSPILGGLALVGGVALLVAGARNKS